MPRMRLDVLMTEQGLAQSRSLAQRLIMAGKVRVNGQVIFKPADLVNQEAEISLEQPPPFVSRGGEKLAAAICAFDINWTGKICADVGASTGGFTDCLLQHGVEKVYAIDVGEGILDWRLRNNARVIVMEKTNARYIDKLPEAVHCITIDVSFISLKVILPVVAGWFEYGGDGITAHRHGEIIALIKPQFEAGKQEAARGKGVIRDEKTHQRIINDILEFAEGLHYRLRGLIRSPLLGQKGNVEFLAWLEYGCEKNGNIKEMIDPLFNNNNVRDYSL